MYRSQSIPLLTTAKRVSAETKAKLNGPCSFYWTRLRLRWFFGHASDSSSGPGIDFSHSLQNYYWICRVWTWRYLQYLAIRPRCCLSGAFQDSPNLCQLPQRHFMGHGVYIQNACVQCLTSFPCFRAIWSFAFRWLLSSRWLRVGRTWATSSTPLIFFLYPSWIISLLFIYTYRILLHYPSISILNNT